jgi:hypothetical protein
VEEKIKDVGECKRGGREMSVRLEKERGSLYRRRRKGERRVRRKRKEEGTEGNMEAEEER